jgi:hypothetical protein
VGRQNDNLTVNLTQVLGQKTINEIKGGYSGYSWFQDSILRWPNHPQAPELTHGSPIINLRGYTVGQAHSFSYQNIKYQPYNIRDDFTYSLDKAGRHDVKVGGEYFRTYDPVWHLHLVSGRVRRHRRPTAGQHRADLPGVEQRRQLESQRPQRRDPVIHDRDRRLLGETDRKPHWGVAAGRLGGDA